MQKCGSRTEGTLDDLQSPESTGELVWTQVGSGSDGNSERAEGVGDGVNET